MARKTASSASRWGARPCGWLNSCPLIEASSCWPPCSGCALEFSLLLYCMLLMSRSLHLGDVRVGMSSHVDGPQRPAIRRVPAVTYTCGARYLGNAGRVH